MAELADAPDLGSGGQTRAGSSPVIRSIRKPRENLEKTRVLARLFYLQFFGTIPTKQLSNIFITKK